MSNINIQEIMDKITQPIEDAEQELRDLPVLIAQVGYTKADAESALAAAKSKAKLLEAELDTEYREKFQAEGRKVTEKVIASAVMQDNRTKIITDKMQEWDTLSKQLTAIQGALYARHRSALCIVSAQKADSLLSE